MGEAAATNSVDELSRRLHLLERATAQQDTATRTLHAASSVAAAGGALLALTAVPWLVRERDIDTAAGTIGTVDQHVSLWAMLGTVNDSYRGLAVMAVLALTGFALLCLAWPLLGRNAGPLATYGWIAAGITGLIMLVADAGFRPTVGAWATLVTCAVLAIAATSVVIVNSARRRT